MMRKTSKRRGTSVIAALVVLCAVLGYGLTEWKPLTDTPQAVPASREAPGRQGPVSYTHLTLPTNSRV